MTSRFVHRPYLGFQDKIIYIAEKKKRRDRFESLICTTRIHCCDITMASTVDIFTFILFQKDGVPSETVIN